MENIENNNLIDDIDQGTNPCNVLETRHPKERNRLGLFVLITITVLFLFIGIGLGIFFGVKNRNPVQINISVDPQVISSGEIVTHTQGACSYVFNKKDGGQKEYATTTNIEFGIGDKVKYDFTLDNVSSVKVKYTFELYNLVMENVRISYQIDDGEIIDYIGYINWKDLSENTSSHFYLYIEIIDPMQDASISGDYYLILMEVDKYGKQ